MTRAMDQIPCQAIVARVLFRDECIDQVDINELMNNTPLSLVVDRKNKGEKVNEKQLCDEICFIVKVATLYALRRKASAPSAFNNSNDTPRFSNPSRGDESLP